MTSDIAAIPRSSQTTDTGSPVTTRRFTASALSPIAVSR